MARAKDGSGSPARTTYDRLKVFQGRGYTGMAIGRGHKWTYDAGDWTEKKITPDRWEIHYAVKKHRKGRAPEGSGAPVGTSHRWYIVADQIVTKLDANTYSTELKGTKFMVGYKRADKQTWSVSEAARRRKLLRILREMATELERPPSEAPGPAAAPAPRREPVTAAARPRRSRSQSGSGRSRLRRARFG